MNTESESWLQPKIRICSFRDDVFARANSSSLIFIDLNELFVQVHPTTFASGEG